MDAVRAPGWPAVAAATGSLMACAALIPAVDSWRFAVAGYTVGALVVPTLTVVFRFGRRTAAQSPFFLPNRGMERLVLWTLVLGIGAGLANAWLLATELAKK